MYFEVSPVNSCSLFWLKSNFIMQSLVFNYHYIFMFVPECSVYIYISGADTHRSLVSDQKCNTVLLQPARKYQSTALLYVISSTGGDD